jgi:type III pantothenate kinase
VKAGEPLFLLDIGNSRVHVGVWDGRGLRRLDLAHDQRADLPRALATLAAGATIAEAAMISVREETVSAEVLANLARAGCRSPHFFQNPLELPLTMAVKSPQTVGLDRLMNVLGARSLAAGTHVVLDFGTALTLSVLDAEDRFLGGAIAPGASLMARALEQGTARLPLVRDPPPVAAIGKDTREAIASGVHHAVVGAARELMRGALRELGADVAVWATGGDAARFAGSLPEIANVDPDLTLRGLRFAFARLPG